MNIYKYKYKYIYIYIERERCTGRIYLYLSLFPVLPCVPKHINIINKTKASSFLQFWMPSQLLNLNHVTAKSPSAGWDIKGRGGAARGATSGVTMRAGHGSKLILDWLDFNGLVETNYRKHGDILQKPVWSISSDITTNSQTYHESLRTMMQ